jgi:hypothetical protein
MKIGTKLLNKKFSDKFMVEVEIREIGSCCKLSASARLASFKRENSSSERFRASDSLSVSA